YGKLRPTLKQPKDQVKKINDDIALHASLSGLAGLLEDQALCIVQGVGYPNPSQSHFRSMDIWQAASTAETLTEGWIGRALKQVPGAPSFHLKSNNERSPLALEGAPARVPSIASLQEFQLQLAGGADAKAQREVIEGSVRPLSPPLPGGERGKGPGLLDFVQRTASN